MTTTMTFDLNDLRLTAYALGELHGGELTEFEQLLAESSAARDALAEIRETTSWLHDELATESPLALTAEQHLRLEGLIAAEADTLAPVLSAPALSPSPRRGGLGRGADRSSTPVSNSSPLPNPPHPGEGEREGEGTKPALNIVTVALADARRKEARHRWAVLAAVAATTALAAAAMVLPPSSGPAQRELIAMRDSNGDAVRLRQRGYLYLAENDPNLATDDVMNFTLTQGVVGPKNGGQHSVLWGERHSLLSDTLGVIQDGEGISPNGRSNIAAGTTTRPLGSEAKGMEDGYSRGAAIRRKFTTVDLGKSPSSSSGSTSTLYFREATPSVPESLGRAATVLILTPRILVQEEAESLLGVPAEAELGRINLKALTNPESLSQLINPKDQEGRKKLDEVRLRLTRQLAEVEKVVQEQNVKQVPSLSVTLQDLDALVTLNTGDAKAVTEWYSRVASQQEQVASEAYAAIHENPFLTPAEQPLSTFSVDVDTASYANVRRFLNQGQLPPADAVRIEELVNYFKYDDAPPADGQPFAVKAEAAPCPWQKDHYLARISLKAREIAKAQRPPTNLVFLLDVSGSMQDANKLPLVKRAMSLLIEELGERDRVSIVTYAGDAGLKLEPTVGSDQTKITQAIESLSAGGSTNGAAGIQLAYEQALRHFSKESANRVILCTDGDFNVGVSSDDELTKLIEEQAKSGVFLSIFGFGMGNLKDSKLEKLADKGNGHYGYIDDLNEARKNFNEELMGTLYTVAKDVKLQVEFNPLTVGAYRLIGYENRVMAAEDFNNDAKDAGEIGAGHTVTALYEVVPRGKWKPQPAVDPLKYTATEAKNPSPPAPLPAGVRNGEDRAGRGEQDAESADDLFTVKLRYKQPDAAASVRTVDVVVDDIAGKKVTPSRDLLWSASVASFGMQLRHSRHAGTWTMADVLETARGAKGDDTTGRRGEFIELVKAAMKLMPAQSKPEPEQPKRPAVGF